MFPGCRFVVAADTTLTPAIMTQVRLIDGDTVIPLDLSAPAPVVVPVEYRTADADRVLVLAFDRALTGTGGGSISLGFSLVDQQDTGDSGRSLRFDHPPWLRGLGRRRRRARSDQRDASIGGRRRRHRTRTGRRSRSRLPVPNSA